MSIGLYSSRRNLSFYGVSGGIGFNGFRGLMGLKVHCLRGKVFLSTAGEPSFRDLRVRAGK